MWCVDNLSMYYWEEAKILIYYPMERAVNQVLWEKFMGDLGCNWDCIYENDTFCVKAYDWSDVDDYEHYSNEWHFWHKPSGLKVCWYKYPLRGCECNMKGLSNEFFLEVLKDCYNSRQEDEHGNVFYDCCKWWNRVESEVEK